MPLVLHLFEHFFDGRVFPHGGDYLAGAFEQAGHAEAVRRNQSVCKAYESAEERKAAKRPGNHFDIEFVHR